MTDEPTLRARIHARDLGLRRVRAVTTLVAAGAAALAAGLAGLAAQSSAARKAEQPRVRRSIVPSPARRTGIPAPPPLPASSAAPAPAPAPVPSSAPPVVVSGGS